MDAMTNEEINEVLEDIDGTLALIHERLGPVELLVARNLHRTVDLLLAAIRSGVVEASEDQVAGLEMGQARLRVAVDPDG